MPRRSPVFNGSDFFGKACALAVSAVVLVWLFAGVGPAFWCFAGLGLGVYWILIFTNRVERSDRRDNRKKSPPKKRDGAGKR